MSFGLFTNEEKYGWSSINVDDYKISIKGNNEVINSVVDYFTQHKSNNYDNVGKFLNTLTSNFAFVYQNEFIVIAAVDRLSSYNIFYYNHFEIVQFSNSSRRLSYDYDQTTIDRSSVLNLRMSGYTLGKKTILKNIYRVEAGEYVIYKKVQKKLLINEYTSFYSCKSVNRSPNELIDELDYITDNIFLRNINNADGATIWVPLSGGLDSRFVLCKLLQLGYDNIRTFSFGVPNNYDALRAQEVAKKLGVDWFFLPPTPSHLKTYYNSKDRINYWKYADGLFTVPNLQWMYAMQELIKQGEMNFGDVIINGNAGDFITGQHIPNFDNNDVLNDIYPKIIQKHFSLNSQLLNKSTINSIIEEINLGSIVDEPSINPRQLAKLYELWEWKERQSKRVVNAQRNYEYLGLRWELPLWDKEYFDFWRDLDIIHREHGSLFFSYLKRKDFYGLFNKYDPFMSRWPRDRLYIQFIGSAIKYTLGPFISRHYYKRLDWYSSYQFLYQYIGKEKYLSKYKTYKGFLPHYVDTWLSENIKNGQFINK